MLALAIECSNERGMGHLFRAFQYIDYLNDKNIDYLLMVNNDDTAKKLLEERKIKYLVVDYADTRSNWEKKVIDCWGIDRWFNDKYETSDELGRHVRDEGVAFYLIDDVGDGERYASVSFSGMLYPYKKRYKCSNVIKGVEYIILNPEIKACRRIRTSINRIIVCLGGSDTYGATIGVVEELKRKEVAADIVVGPSFNFTDQLYEANSGEFQIYQNVPSLIRMFMKYDFAITGGGVTCCEAMASGLPCAIIANELHEIETGKFFADQGSGIFWGYHLDWRKNTRIDFENIDVQRMSKRGLEIFSFDAVEKIFEIILDKKEIIK